MEKAYEYIVQIAGMYKSPDEFIAILEEGQEPNKNKKGQGWFFLHSGIALAESSRFDFAIKCWENAIPYFIRDKDEEGLACCYGNLGLVYTRLGNVILGTEFKNKRLSIIEKKSKNIDQTRTASKSSLFSIFQRKPNNSKVENDDRRNQQNPANKTTLEDNTVTAKNKQRQPPQANASNSYIGENYVNYGELGQGGFGIVYKVYSKELAIMVALKTFRDDLFKNQEVVDLFRKEANTWIQLGYHENLVSAHSVENLWGRLYIAMDYIAPNDTGLNSLEGYLKYQPPDFIQSIKWAIQFCDGISYAYSKGIRCHRDIKPANILITADKTLKITDFGLANVVASLAIIPQTQNLNINRDKVRFSILDSNCFGTVTHMPPEQFVKGGLCDERSDIYAFGIVLYQMMSGGKVPFLASLPGDDSIEGIAQFKKAMFNLHRYAPVPKLNNRLFPIIKRCLEKDPANRYSSFIMIREDLQSILKSRTGETIQSPEHEEESMDAILLNKGGSYHKLGRYKEAIQIYDEILAKNPQNAMALNHKGNSLDQLDRIDEALKCFDRALQIDPKHIAAWNNKAFSLHKLGKYKEAIKCCEKQLEINPSHSEAWNNKANSLIGLGKYKEAIKCCEKQLEINPAHMAAWFNKGLSLQNLSSFNEALYCYDKALEINPRLTYALVKKGEVLHALGRYTDELKCYNLAIEINPVDIYAWYSKAFIEESFYGKKAADSYKKLLDLAVAQNNEMFAKAASEGLRRLKS